MHPFASGTIFFLRRLLLAALFMHGILFLFINLSRDPQTEALGKRLLAGYKSLLILLTRSVTWALVTFTLLQLSIIVFATFHYALHITGARPNKATILNSTMIGGTPLKPSQRRLETIKFYSLWSTFTGTCAFGTALLNTPKGTPALSGAAHGIRGYLPSCVVTVAVCLFAVSVGAIVQNRRALRNGTPLMPNYTRQA